MDESEEERTKRIRTLWNKLDVRNEGSLDVVALKRGLKKLEHPLQDADDLISDVLQAADINHDGRVQFDEFRRFVGETEALLRGLFDKIDRDHSGNVDKAELKDAFARAGLGVSDTRLEHFFNDVDKNNDGVISFVEWRDFLLFMPPRIVGLRAVLSYYQSTVKVNSEGDVNLGDETIQGLGYFLAGGLSGVASRTTTAPLDRLKVYLIAQTETAGGAIEQAKKGAPLQATKQGAGTLVNACRELWAAGGIRSLFAGNGLNVVKVMPESAVKFGSYEAAKRVIARLEGHGDAKRIKSSSQFIAGGIAGMMSQAVVYPLDTLKFRMQNDTVKGGLRGNALIIATAKNMWARDGLRSFYRGLTMGLVGMFPYAAIDLGTFEYLKRTLVARRASQLGISEEAALPGNFTLALMGAFSGAFGASAVYPVNLLRTRLQTQGTAAHPRTYTGVVDVTMQTIKGEGVKGLFKGLTPNLMKVIPAVSITYVVYENTKKALQLR